MYPKLLQEGFDYHSAYSHYEEGIVKLENSNINEKWWKEAKDKFLNADIFPILGMEKQMILDEVKYTVNKYKTRTYEECGFVGNDFVDEVIRKIEEINIL